MQEFTLADRTRLCDPDPDWEIDGEITGDYRKVRLSRLIPGEQFAYVFVSSTALGALGPGSH